MTEEEIRAKLAEIFGDKSQKIIHCGDCKYFHRGNATEYCTYDNRRVMSADFCSFAERGQKHDLL